MTALHNVDGQLTLHPFSGFVVRSTLVVCGRKLDCMCVCLFVCVFLRIFREFCRGGKDVGARATEHAEFEKWILKKPFFNLISG